MNRRTAVLMVVMAALIPGLWSSPASADHLGLISPPSGPLLYRRTVERQLVDGASIVATREFTIHFRRTETGFIVDGEQISARIDMPPGLERIAQLEEARVETGIFPLSLDPFGRIVSSAGADTDQRTAQEIVDQALSQITALPIAEGERDALQDFVISLHAAGPILIAQLPADLFAPFATPRSDTQQVALETGELGTVTSRFECICDQHTGLMRSAQREVLTQIGDDRRVTRETWELVSLDDE